MAAGGGQSLGKAGQPIATWFDRLTMSGVDRLTMRFVRSMDPAPIVHHLEPNATILAGH
jgi:hypothetical protein